MDILEDEEWQNESDRVQWFRAEAELFRWLEQFERKHFEFQRLLRTFRVYSMWWREQGDFSSVHSGLRAFALRQECVNLEMEADTELLFARQAHREIIGTSGDVEIADVRDVSYSAMVKNCMKVRRRLIDIVYLRADDDTEGWL